MVDTTAQIHEILEDNITVEENATIGDNETVEEASNADNKGTKRKRPRNRKARGRGRGRGKGSQSEPKLGPELHLPRPIWNHGPGQFPAQQSWVPNDYGYPPHPNWTYGHFQPQPKLGPGYFPHQSSLNSGYGPLQQSWYPEPYYPWNAVRLSSQPYQGDLTSVAYYNSHIQYSSDPYLQSSLGAYGSVPIPEQLLTTQPLERDIDCSSVESPNNNQSRSRGHTSNDYFTPENGQSPPVNCPLTLPKFSRKFKFVDTEEKLGGFLARLQKVPTHTEEIYIDCEGDNLPKTLSTVQVHFQSTGETFLLDVTVLGAKVFEKELQEEPHARTFKQILEDPEVPISVFGGHPDSYALFQHYRVGLKNPLDLQVMGDFIRKGNDNPKERHGLLRCVDDNFVGNDKDLWKKIKMNGKKYCQQHGYEVFEQRPLRQNLQEYAAGDVQILPHLHALYEKRIKGDAFLLAQISALSQEQIDDGVSTALRDASRDILD